MVRKIIELTLYGDNCVSCSLCNFSKIKLSDTYRHSRDKHKGEGHYTYIEEVPDGCAIALILPSDFKNANPELCLT